MPRQRNNPNVSEEHDERGLLIRRISMNGALRLVETFDYHEESDRAGWFVDKTMALYDVDGNLVHRDHERSMLADAMRLEQDYRARWTFTMDDDHAFDHRQHERAEQLRLLRDMGAIHPLPTIERDHDWEREDLLPLRNEMHAPSFPPPATEVVSTNANGVFFSPSFLTLPSSSPPDHGCSLARGCQGFCTTCSRCLLHCTCEKKTETEPTRRIKL